VFPQGLRIGEVTQLVPLRDTGGHGLYREVIIQPSADLSKIDLLFVVLRQKEGKGAPATPAAKGG
jgi:cell shape-determining protein MreC